MSKFDFLKLLLRWILPINIYTSISKIYKKIQAKKSAAIAFDTNVNASVFQKHGLSVIIPSANRSYHLDKLIDDLDIQLKKTNLDFEIILCLQSSKHNKSINNDITVIHFDHLIGFSGAVNEASRIANYDYFLILNDDLIIPHNFIERLTSHIAKSNFSYLTPITILKDLYIKSEDKYSLIDGKKYNIEKNRNGSPIVINAGSNQNGDIGFMQPLDKLELTKPKSLCGACLLINTKYLKGSDIFVHEMFAYFEDKHLTEQFKDNTAAPLVVDKELLVRHDLSSSSTTSDKQDLINRAKCIYDYLIHNTEIPIEYVNKDIIALTGRYHKGQLYNSHKTHYKRVCIYNIYFSTKGGGEQITIDFAEELSKKDNFTVYIPTFSQEEFEYVIDSISDTNNSLRVILINRDELLKNLSWFDILINFSHSTDLSRLGVTCIKYIHFPCTKLDNTVTHHRIFNSNFSKSHAKNPSINTSVLYPVKLNNDLDKKKITERNKSIIILGRFFEGFHMKNQHLAIKAYVDSEISKQGWKLQLIGHVSNKNLKYFNYCKKISSDKNIEFYKGITHEEKNKLLMSGSVILSCTGMNSKNPNEQEHFGISVVEGISYGLYPIVYNSGGPREILELIQTGSTYDNYNQLCEILRNLETTDIILKKHYVDKIHDIFGVKTFTNNLDKIINEQFI
jgi:GT2 family glycosyltransferase